MDSSSDVYMLLEETYTPGDDTEQIQPQYVTLADVEIVPGLGSAKWPPPSPYNFPPVAPAGYAYNKSQARPSVRAPAPTPTFSPPPSAAGSRANRTRKKGSSSKASARGGAQGPKKKGNGDTCTLDELWFASGKDWSKVQPTSQEKQTGGPKKGLASCQTGPECCVCGTSLSLAEIGTAVPCRVCGCFN
ncbi:hypothetical protein GGR54DRAFT_224379 [Hypoxylon sp. NC1633]|nr:hypothetical protein GGR54DRAFT_224379 [Hypoxylon sp. NC1633]